MKNTKDLSLDPKYIKAFLLGDYGTGKSTFASTFPTPGFVFDFDGRASTYRGKDWDYETFSLDWKGWVSFEKTLREVKKAQEEEGKYKTIVLDSSTSMTDIAMERALQLDPKRSPEGGPIWNVHFQIVRNLMEPKLHTFLNLDCNIIVCGHWKITLDSKTGAVERVDPLLTGQLSQKVPGYFDEVYTTFTRRKDGKEEFYIRTVTKGWYKARSTISGPMRLLPDEIPNNYEALQGFVQEAILKEKEVRKRE